MKYRVYSVDENGNAVHETTRISEKDAMQDIDLLRMLGKRMLPLDQYDQR